MPDLKTRFRGTERMPTPDLWPDIMSREPRPPGPEPSSTRRVLVATFAFAIAVAGVGFAIRSFERPQGRYQPVAPAPIATNGVIAYASIGTQGVFRTVLPDGSDPIDVHVDVPGFVSLPSWSPDGTRIAFDVNSFEDPHPKGGYFDIYTANADGTDPTRLTFEKVDHSPVWSPDGSRIAYVHAWDDQQIWVVNADGSGPLQLTASKGPNLFPSWSPDGTRIAFVSLGGSNSDIYVMNSDGSEVQRLTDDPAHDDQPAWSPDGRLIAFLREGSGDPGIYTMAPDGTGVTELLHDPDPANLGFAWSPDGAKMAVVSITGPGYDRTVRVLDLATGRLTSISEPGAWYGPSWQPLPALPTPSQESLAPYSKDAAGPVQLSGVPFPVCRPMSIAGSFGAGLDSEWVFEKAVDSACDAGGGMQYLGVGTPNSVTLISGPIQDADMHGAELWPLAAADVNGDGVDELEIGAGTTGGSTRFGLFRIEGSEIIRITWCANCGALADWGGNHGHQEGAFCDVNDGQPAFATWDVELSDDGSQLAGWLVHYSLHGSTFEEIAREKLRISADSRDLLPPGGATELCGSTIHPADDFANYAG